MSAVLTALDVAPGDPRILGARVDGSGSERGVNFSVRAEGATRVELCVFDAEGRELLGQVDMHGPQDHVWHARIKGLGAGCVYAYRAHGPWNPAKGQWWNPNKLLLDPQARDIIGEFTWQPAQFAYQREPVADLAVMSKQDNAAIALKARVVPEPSIAPGGTGKRRVADGERVLYEMHVKGWSQQCPWLPANLRGTFTALAHPQSIAWFQRMGITTLSLLPVHYAIDEAHLAEKGLTNFWGYNSIGFFAANPRLARAGASPHEAALELRDAIAALHEAGLEVVLDVVYNHTAEGSEWGPVIGPRGLEHGVWYCTDEDGHCINFTGCGNTVRVEHVAVRRFVLDSLRWWVERIGADGFRFDLAATMGREQLVFTPDAAFFRELAADPVLSKTVLIAESWDGGPQGYQVGHFPPPFLEWNDQFRDVLREYWLGRPVAVRDLMQRLAGSPDLYAHRPADVPSVNFITAHDGYTLADMLSYRSKHNHANGEDNRDGRDNELCENFGVEGPSDDAALRSLRLRIRRSLQASLMLSGGAPMLLAGDELGNSQCGNNNAYCQDNEIGWVDWPAEVEAETGADWLARCAALRRSFRLGDRTQWFTARGDVVSGDSEPSTAQPLMALTPSRETGDERWLVVCNPGDSESVFQLPEGGWTILLDAAADAAPANIHKLPAHSLRVLRGRSALPMNAAS